MRESTRLIISTYCVKEVWSPLFNFLIDGDKIITVYSGTIYMVNKKGSWCMKIFTSSPLKGLVLGKLKFLNVNPHWVTHYFKGINKKIWMVQTTDFYKILRKVMAVQRQKFLKFNNYVNNEKLILYLKYVEYWGWSTQVTALYL
jgi:hypothetical protein